MALKEIASRHKENYVICCDSKSVLQAIGHFNTFHPIVLEIMEWLHLLKSRKIKVSFCWSPAHIGIAGNEEVDFLAKAAINNNTIIKSPIPSSDVFPIIRSALSDAWSFSWQLENQKMREITGSIHPWKYSPLTRKNEVILCRLRIGHTRVKRYDIFYLDEMEVPTAMVIGLTISPPA